MSKLDSIQTKRRDFFLPSKQLVKQALKIVAAACLIGQAKSDDQTNNDDFGKPVYDDKSESQIVLPITEAQNQRKEQLNRAYGEGKLSIQIDSIDPEAGPTSGSTRVTVRGGPFEDMNLLYPKPKCKFGRHDKIVSATYVSCSENPLKMEDVEGKHSSRMSWCLQCEDSPVFDAPGIIPLSVSLTGDFSDSNDSEPFRYYPPTILTSIYPRYGPKDGNTFVEVWGENFLNFDENLKCNFGSKSVTAHFINSNYITCRSPSSDVVDKPIPFTVSLNKQQNSRVKNIDFWYYNQPQVVELVPNYGPDQGGNLVLIKGNNFQPFGPDEIDNSNDTFCVFDQNGKMPLKVTNSTRAYCQAPPNIMKADYVHVEIMLNNREEQSTDDHVPYFYYKPPKIFDVSPVEGPTSGGTVVILSGLELKAGKKIICMFGEQKTIGKLISATQVKCLSPKVPSPGPVPLSITYEGDGQHSQSEQVSYLYYESPTVLSIEPQCGPTYGYTQVTVKGTNFVDMGFGKVKCIFNGTHMNGTIVDKQTIKCSSPKLNEDQESLDSKFMYSNVQVTLNGVEASDTSVKFDYYPELEIFQTYDQARGPISGNTQTQIGGRGFANPNVCNPKVRFGAIEVTPKVHNDTNMQVISPAVGVPDAVVLTLSGNGQNYGRDVTLHQRDNENTFTYYQDILILDMVPAMGPTQGKTKLYFTGFGFKQFLNDDGTQKDQPLYIRFVDQFGQQIGNVSSAEQLTDDDFVWHTPPAQAGTQANVQLSFNQKNWQEIILSSRKVAYSYYDAPTIESIEPHFGPVKNPSGKYSIISGKNFECLEKNCDSLIVRFGSESNATYVRGELLSDTKIKVQIPRYPKPDVLPIAVSFNKQDFTSDYVTYGFFDPFLLDIQPRIISSSGSTQLSLQGFGFVFSNADAIKAKFGTKNLGEISCSGVQPCVKPAKYVDKNKILTNTLPRNVMLLNGTQMSPTQGMTVEVSVYDDVFTNNNLEVYYAKDLIFQSLSKKNVPNNFNHLLYVDTDFQWDQNDFDSFKKYGNFTCKFTVGDETVFTQARMETSQGMYSADQGETKPTHIVCASPKMHNSGKGKMYISINGQDFIEAFDYESSAPVDVYRIVPQCGPKEGKTKVKMMGSGFVSQNSDAVFGKFGPIGVEKFQKENVINQVWYQQDWLNAQFMTESDLLKFDHTDHKLDAKELLNTIVVQSPQIQSQTIGGPVYVSVGQHSSLISKNSSDELVYQYSYSNSLVEFYYYKIPQVKKVEPTSGLTSGGTPVEISGIWFDQKTEYGLFPFCKIGNMIVRASFISTVRIVCYSPPSEYILAPLPIKVSLNGQDWHDTGFQYSYYYQPEVYKNFPSAGPMQGGTEVYISGEHFSNITNVDNVRCKFTLFDSQTPGRKVESRTTPAFFMNETMMWCASPSGFLGGDKCYVSLTFNGMDYSQDTDTLTFTYFSINGAFPHSGPTNPGDEVILIKGQGFNPKSKVYCSLNHTDQLAVEITPTLIKCPMNYQGKDPLVTGGVKFGMSMDGSWTDFGIFYYYTQIELNDVQPTYGPNIGQGLVYLYGSNFRNDFINVEIGCKIGDAIGQGELVDASTIRCVVEEMDLTNQGESLPVYAALNSYSWVGGSSNRRLRQSNQLQYVPYGIIQVNPDSGPFDGFTDILITGKGFQEQYASKAKCRFGVDGNYAIVDATVIDYYKMACRSPESFAKEGGDAYSVPFGISFNDEEFKPWTKGINRFHFYQQAIVEYAEPNEVKIGKMAEIYLFAQPGSRFIRPVPSQSGSGVSCSFEQFGQSMGMFVNETTVLCMTPHFAGTSEDYYIETVVVGVALNGQDFGETLSHAEVTFVGTGSNTAFWQFVIAALLIALLLLACATCLTALAAWWQTYKNQQKQNLQPHTLALRNSEGSVQRSYNQGYNISNSRASQGFRNSQQI